MTEQEIFEGLKKLALEDLANVPEGDIADISFCVFMTATRPDGSAIGGAFIVDKEISEELDSEELVKTGSLPSLTSYIMLRQSKPVVNRCITAAVTLQNLDGEEYKVTDPDLEGSKH